MTQEEAIERIKSRYDKWALDDKDLEAIQCTFPELAKSEDERTKKELIDTIKRLSYDRLHISEELRDKYIAWIEKQKPAWSEEDERIRRQLVDFLEHLYASGKDTSFDNWSKADCSGWIAWLEKQKECVPENSETGTQKEQKPSWKPTQNQAGNLDRIDQWLLYNFGLLPGSCSSIMSLRYSIAREIAEALWPHGYIQSSTDKNLFYWNDDTRRSPKLEKGGNPFTFEPISKNKAV